MKPYPALVIVALVVSLGANGYLLFNQLQQKDHPLAEDSKRPVLPNSSPSGSKKLPKPTSSAQNKSSTALGDVTLHKVREDTDFLSFRILGAFTSSKDCQYAVITFLTYDKSGNRVGTADDIISDLKAGEVWNFEARGLRGASASKLESAECDNYE